MELLVDLANMNNFLYSLIRVTAENLGDAYIWEIGGRFETNRQSMTNKTRITV